MQSCLLDEIRKYIFPSSIAKFFLDHPSAKAHLTWPIRSEDLQPPLSHQGAIKKYFLPLKITLSTAGAQTECQQTGPVRLLY